MIISLKSYPQLATRAPITATLSGDVLTVNRKKYDLSSIPDGATLPNANKATGCWYFEGAIERIDGMLHVTLRMPVSDHPTQAQAFPEPLHITGDGPIHFPADDTDMLGKTAQEYAHGN